MCDNHKPTFDEATFVKAIEAATAFLQGRMCLQHWQFGLPHSDENDKNPFTFRRNPHYRAGHIIHAPMDSKHWAHFTDDELARSMIHELAHAVIAPIDDQIRGNLDGNFFNIFYDACETTADHITTIVWSNLAKSDKDYLLGLFAKARIYRLVNER